MSIVNLSARTDPEAFGHILRDPAFAGVEADPRFGRFGRAYYPSVYGDQDCSFAISLKDTPALVCLCSAFDQKLGYYGMPLKFIVRQDLDGLARRAAIDSAFLRIDELVKEYHLREATVLDDSEGVTSPIGEACRLRGAAMHSNPVAWVDLAAGPAAWRAALRKSSRSLINWGRRHLSMRYVNKDTPDRSLFDRYRAFHAEVAGRATRSDQSWEVMHNWIAAGGGELAMAFLEGRLVAGSMFTDGSELSFYASGVYDRTQFDKPLGHYPVWLGIERAHARGMRRLELGAVPARNTVPDKEYQIGYFKRGFATHIEDQVVWRLLSASEAAA